MDEGLDEVSWIDGLESRPGDLLGVADVAVGEEPAREGRSIRDTGFQFQRDGKLGPRHLQRIRGVARRRDPDEKKGGRTVNDGSRVRSQLVRQSGDTRILGRCLAEGGLRHVFPILRRVLSATGSEDDGPVLSRLPATGTARRFRQSYAHVERSRGRQP